MQRTANTIRSRCGYTLLELLMVIGLLGLASALLIPNMVQRDSMRTQAAVRTLISDISFAQTDALAHQQFRKVYFYPDGSGYCIVRVSESNYGSPFDASTADYIVDPMAGGGLYIVNLQADNRFDGVSLTSVNIDGTGRELIFDPLGGTIRAGGLPGLGGSIEITSGDHAYQINIAPFTGKLTVSKL